MLRICFRDQVPPTSRLAPSTGLPGNIDSHARTQAHVSVGCQPPHKAGQDIQPGQNSAPPTSLPLVVHPATVEGLT